MQVVNIHAKVVQLIQNALLAIVHFKEFGIQKAHSVIAKLDFIKIVRKLVPVAIIHVIHVLEVIFQIVVHVFPVNKDIYQLIVAHVILSSGITIQLHVYHVNILAKVVKLIQNALLVIVHFKEFGIQVALTVIAKLDFIKIVRKLVPVAIIHVIHVLEVIFQIVVHVFPVNKDIYQLIVAHVILSSGITIQLHVYHVNILAKVVQLIQNALLVIVHFKEFGIQVALTVIAKLDFIKIVRKLVPVAIIHVIHVLEVIFQIVVHVFPVNKDIYQLIVAHVILSSGITIQLHVYHVNILAKVVKLIQNALLVIVHFKEFGIQVALTVICKVRFY